MQVLVYFAVAKKGDLPTDGKTDVNPEGLTAAFGKHAQTFADRLAIADLSCKASPSPCIFMFTSGVLCWPYAVHYNPSPQVLNKTDFQKSMLEKLIWIR